MVNAKTKKTVKSTGSSPERKSSKQKLSAKKTTSRKRQQKVKKTSKKTTTKIAAQRKSSKENSNNGVYKPESTLKVQRTNVNELKKVENVIEKLSQGPEPSVQKRSRLFMK